MKEDSTAGLEAEQLARLMRIGEEEKLSPDDVGEEEFTAELLGEHLAGTLPLGSTVVDALPLVLGAGSMARNTPWRFRSTTRPSPPPWYFMMRRSRDSRSRDSPTRFRSWPRNRG